MIRKFNLSATPLNDDIAPHFESVLSTNETIEVLDLSGNNLRNKFCAAIAGPLATAPTLRELNLSRNPIGGRGIWVLGRPLRLRENGFTVLNVRGCQIEPQGFREFCREIASNVTLERLFPAHNPIQDIGRVYRGEVLEAHPALKEIDLEPTEISDKTSEAIFPAIGKSKTVTKIKVKNNLVHEGIIIHKAILANRKLRQCIVDLNAIEYKVIVEIDRAIEMNVRNWRDGQNKRVAQQLSQGDGMHGQLSVLRESLAEQREAITTLTAELKQAKTRRVLKEPGSGTQPNGKIAGDH
jgi:hypothetical protein